MPKKYARHTIYVHEEHEARNCSELMWRIA